MRVSLTTRFAVRTLGRSARRTLLSVIGVGVGCAIALFITAFMRGGKEIRIRAVAESGFGHARIAPAGWDVSRENTLRLQSWVSELDQVRSMKSVHAAAPHSRNMGLLAFGTRVSGVELLGVDPPAEVAISRLARAVVQGRYLNENDRGKTVIGSAVAEQLDVELDDDLLLTVVGHDGEMRYAMLRIIGILSTGSREIDASICHVTLPDLERITGYKGAGEITITFTDPDDIDRLSVQIRDSLPEGDTVLTWREVVPSQGGDAASDEAFMNLISGIAVVVVVLGIASAQLTAVLERRREFAVLMALGMRSIQVVRMLLIEAVTLGLLGAVAGLLIGGPLVYHTATKGIDFKSVMKGEMAVSGVLFDPVIYSDMGLWMIPFALAIALGSTIVAVLYPAWFAIRTNPTSALSLREA
jgi:ABC-type lipoprotein release transport system permease subunit